MTDSDTRNEVWVSCQEVDSHSGYIIKRREVSLKSKDESIDNLIKKAKKLESNSS